MNPFQGSTVTFLYFNQDASWITDEEMNNYVKNGKIRIISANSGTDWWLIAAT
jgi:hypothetical protein